MQRALVLATLVAASVAAWWGPVTTPDLKWLDAQWNLSRGPTPADDRVVVVGIDERSIAVAHEPLALWHRQFGELLLAAREARPTLVALDVVLPDRSFGEIAPGLDQALVRALLLTRGTFPTILAITVDETRKPRRVHPAFIAAAGAKPGLALWPLDSDGVVRRFDEQLGERGETIESFAGNIARAAGVVPRAGYVDFSAGAPFTPIPFAEVLEAHRRGDGEWLRQRLGGRIVLVGSTLKFDDVLRVPVALSSAAPAEETPGVMLVAQSLRASLAGRFVEPASSALVALLTALAAALCLLATTPRRAWLIGATTLAGLGFASHFALRAGTFLPIAWAAGASIAGLACMRGIDVLRNLAERRRLRRSFGGYVSPAVMEEILSGHIRPDSAGTQRFVCALFSDIRNYTTRSEGMRPPQIIAFLNRYFEGVVASVHDHGGTVISFMGDGIMAVFGAPQDLENPCESGFRAAHAMLESIRVLNAELQAEGVEPIAVGIGLHAGEAVAGHVGSRSRHDYTAIGDVVNVASRLEGSTKEAGYRIVVSKEVAERLGDRASLVPLGKLAIKGHTPVESFGCVPAESPRPYTIAKSHGAAEAASHS